MIFPKRASHHLISLAGVAHIDVQSRDESFKLVTYEQLLMSLTADDCGKKKLISHTYKATGRPPAHILKGGKEGLAKRW